MDEMHQKVEWVAVDWGTTNLRLWLMASDGTPLKQLSSEKGMAVLRPEEFEAVLLAMLEPFLTAPTLMPVLCCGMVGSRQGWAEAKYLVTPCATPTQSEATRVKTKSPKIEVSILPGVKQESPADVMRGEETQIAGFLKDNSGFSGTICLPGTHSKWVRIKAGQIVAFQTFMTGEMFSLLSKKSVLRHAMDTNGWDQAAFDASVSDAIAHPELGSAKLFALRANHLIAVQSPETGLSRLSGLLIGLELAATRAYWQGSDVSIIGARTISELYRTSLNQLDVKCAVADVTTMTLSGLSMARAFSKEIA